ncbi:NAD(P)H-dependent oxidoreductase [Nonomuraea angiospora]|uniref:NAD(P)H-dependent oxidoreductase n=1 Tax=Nonomuraea angiospora TaxID=46172 RepID=UPI00344ED158
MTHVHIVYAHPSERSFTREVLDAFLGGLDDAGHTRTVSDLYAMEFRSELTLEEYERGSGRRADARVPDDVAAEQARLNVGRCCAMARAPATPITGPPSKPGI